MTILEKVTTVTLYNADELINDYCPDQFGFENTYCRGDNCKECWGRPAEGNELPDEEPEDTIEGKFTYAKPITKEVSMTELKPCPFCGHSVSIKNTGIAKCRTENRPSMRVGDYKTMWIITCHNCGIPKVNKGSHYIFTKNGELKVVDGPDGRDEAIRVWNDRV